MLPEPMYINLLIFYFIFLEMRRLPIFILNPIRCSIVMHFLVAPKLTN